MNEWMQVSDKMIEFHEWMERRKYNCKYAFILIKIIIIIIISTSRST